MQAREARVDGDVVEFELGDSVERVRGTVDASAGEPPWSQRRCVELDHDVPDFRRVSLIEEPLAVVLEDRDEVCVILERAGEPRALEDDEGVVV